MHAEILYREKVPRGLKDFDLGIPCFQAFATGWNTIVPVLVGL
jgi:hypothetical protein